MIALTIKEVAQATNGQIINAASVTQTITQVSTDSRAIQSGDLFIALQGDLFDAHEFLAQAEQKGADALLIHQQVVSNLPCILVKDTRIALGQLGAYVRQKISGLKCAAITGSNGKTTTKELLSAILRVHAGDAESVLATKGNFNNDIGLPLTLLRLTEKSRYAVLELGANHQGEIAYTAQLSKPDVALVNNVMPAHLEGFGSLQGVAKAKGEIWQSLSESGIAVVNLDADFHVEYLQQLRVLKRQILTFSCRDINAHIFAENIHFNQLGKASFDIIVRNQQALQSAHIELNLAGQHNISNALAASTMAIALGCQLADIKKGLSTVQEVSGRVNSKKINRFITLIDDTYNANSASVKVAIDLLKKNSGAELLILGDMGELGAYSDQEHRAIGEYAGQKGIQQLITVGKLTTKTHQAYTQVNQGKAIHFDNKQQVNTYLQKLLLKQDTKLTILVKGSRGAKMEEIVNFIEQLLE
jgi:UDP-N-acetylmuramoyl-tripeptide--D-alanyl-D-alanine ligase